MFITEEKTTGELSIFTESFWKFSSKAINRFVLFPDGTCNVIISHTQFSIGRKTFAKGIYLTSIISKPLEIISKGPIYGIRLKAFTLMNIAKCNNIELQGLETIVPLELSHKLVSYVFKETEKCENISEALTTLEMLNYELICNRYSVNENLRDKVNYLLDHKGNVKISTLSTIFNVSRQAFHKSFKKSIGIGPKDLCTTWRLNHYFSLLNNDQSLTTNAYDAGFFDQSHSIKAFKSIWNINPKTYQNNNQGLIQYVNSTITKRFSNFYDPEL